MTNGSNEPTVPGPVAVFAYPAEYARMFSTSDLRRMEDEAEHGKVLHHGGIIYTADIRRELERRGQ